VLKNKVQACKYAHPRHCEEQQRKNEGGATKQSLNTIYKVIFAKIMLRDCFVAPRTKSFTAPRNDGMEDPQCR